jgi:hypothetical protein
VSLIILIERCLLLCLVVVLGYLLWQHHQERLKKLWEAAKEAARIPRPWKAKTPKDCPACKAGVQVAIRPIKRDVKPWSARKSSRGRKKTVKTHGHACPYPDCDYFGITDETVHALVGNGKRGKRGDIQTLKCQCLPNKLQYAAQYPALSSENPS